MPALCFIDTETTSLRHDRQAWEIAMIRREDDGTEEEECIFVEVDLKQADPASLRIGKFWDRHPHGRRILHDDYSRVGFHSKRSAAEFVLEMTNDAHLVGANPAFDAEVLADLLRREGLIPTWHHRLIDVEALTYGSFGRIVGGLDACLDACDITRTGEAHTAMSDALAAKALYDYLIGA